MKVGDLVKGINRIQHVYWNQIGMIIEVTGVLDNDTRYRVLWSVGHKHWCPKDFIEALNENR